MPEKLNLKYFNGTFEDIKNKQRNLWLGVSISLKPYDENLAQQYVSFLSRYSKNRGVIVIGDDIAAINYQVLDNYRTSSSALKKARKEGDIPQKFYENVIKKLDKNEQDRIQVIRWRDIQTKDLENKIEILKQEYQTNLEFQEEIHIPIKSYMNSKNRTITKERLNKLSVYILSELPTILEGVKYDNQRYSAMLYPTYEGSSLDKISCEIQKGERFTHLKKELNITGNHMLIDAYIPKN